MGLLDPTVFLTSGAIGAAIEVTVANIASPTELNARAAAQGDIILARTIEAGTGTQTPPAMPNPCPISSAAQRQASSSSPLAGGIKMRTSIPPR